MLRGSGTTWVGERFAAAASPPIIQSVWSVGQDVYLGAHGGTIYHRRGGQWTRESTGLIGEWIVHQISGSGPTDIWASWSLVRGAR